ncbi:MAG TPA: MauE/DoxX family redox-associated membrane protein [Puia sp.]|jgi:hypothetical protein
MKREIIINLLASVLIFLFLYTFVSKFINYHEFKDSMLGQPLPTWMKPFLLYGLPAAEVVTALLLAAPVTRRIGFVGSLVLMTGFTIYVGMGAAHLFNEVPCSCGGIFTHMSWTNHFYINIGFVLIALFGFLFSNAKISSKAKTRSN